jgi:hypothetical protein
MYAQVRPSGWSLMNYVALLWVEVDQLSIMECLGFWFFLSLLNCGVSYLRKKTANQCLKIISVLNYTLLIKEIGIQVSHRKCDVSYMNQQQNVFSLY